LFLLCIGAGAQQAATVVVMELLSWPRGRQTPTDCDSLLELMDLVAQRQRRHHPASVAESSHEHVQRGAAAVVVQCLSVSLPS